jgi:alpha-ribazole phosphatase/probable phosphoglycerate mutase
LLLVRHGATETVNPEIYWGQTDIALSDTGIVQAERLRERLSLEHIERIYSSDLCRALWTAKIIAGYHQKDITTCSQLREINFGDFEGLTYREISQRYPEASKYWLSHNPGLRFPHGESMAELGNRVTRFLSEYVHPNRGGDSTILIVSHGGVLRIMLCNILGIAYRYWQRLRLDIASLSIVEIYAETATLRILNDVSHLKEDSTAGEGD